MGAGGSRWHSCIPQPSGLMLWVTAPAQVAEAKGKADEARLQAQAALDKANQTRARVESSNKELRELISQVKAFLSRECRHAGGAGRPHPAVRGSAPVLQLHHAALTLHCTLPMVHVGYTTPSPHCIVWSLPQPDCPMLPIAIPCSPALPHISSSWLPLTSTTPQSTHPLCPGVLGGMTLMAPTHRGGG